MKLGNTRLTNQLSRRMEEMTFNATAIYIDVTEGTTTDYGTPNPCENETEIVCSFTDKPDLEQWRDYGDVSQISAEIRVKDVLPTRGSKFTLTGLFGDSSFVDKTFEIVDIRNRGVFGYICALKAVQI